MFFFGSFFKTELWAWLRLGLIVLSVGNAFLVKYIVTYARRRRLHSRMKPLIEEITQKYSAEAVISGSVSCIRVDIKYCCAAISGDNIYIIDRSNTDIHYILPLSSINNYFFLRKNTYQNMKNVKKYVMSFDKILFNIPYGKDKDCNLVLWFSEDNNDYEFNILAVKRCDFFKLLSERIPVNAQSKILGSV